MDKKNSKKKQPTTTETTINGKLQINNLNQLPHQVLLKILLDVHGGLFPSPLYSSCSRVCKIWKQLQPKALRIVHLTTSHDAKIKKCISSILLAQEYNETLTRIVLQSIDTPNICTTVLHAMTTPFLSSTTQRLYTPPLRYLELIGVDLTDRDIELLGDIIRTYNIRRLTLSGVGLIDTHLISLAKSLLSNHFNQLVSLNLSSNSFSRVGLEFLVNAMVETHHFNACDDKIYNRPFYHESHSSMTNSSTSSLAQNSSSTSLQSISSNGSGNNNNNNSSPLSEHHIISFNTKGHKLSHKPKTKNTLTSINLSNNKKLSTDLALVMKTLSKLPLLKDINLDNVPMTPDALLEYINLIRNNGMIDSIHLSNAGIYPKGCEDLSQVLLHHNIKLLDLSENRIGVQGVTSISQSISTRSTFFQRSLSKDSISYSPPTGNLDSLPSTSISNNYNSNNNNLNGIDGTCLRQLYLRRTMISFEECMVLKGLIMVCDTLTILDLSSNQIDSESISLLSEPISKTKSLLDLNLSFNILGANGCHTLSKSIKVNSSIQILRLHCVSMKSEGAEHIFDALTNHPTVSQIHISNNEIKNGGATAVARAIKLSQQHHFTFLDLSFNGIADKGAVEIHKAVKDSFQQMFTITQMDLAGNQLNNKSLQRYLSNPKSKKEDCIVM